MPDYSINTPQVRTLWNEYCRRMQSLQSQAVFNTWILANPISSVQITDNGPPVITITSPTAFHSTNLQKNLSGHIRQSIEAVMEVPCVINYRIGSIDGSTPSLEKSKKSAAASSVPSGNKSFQTLQSTITPTPTVIPSIQPPSDGDNFQSPQPTSTPFSSFGSSASSASNFPAGTPTVPKSPTVEELFSQESIESAAESRFLALARSVGLRPDYTFETFAVSTTNEMAHAAATAVSNRPGQSYNPLFLYGGVGVGKTHLMQAIGANILRNNQAAKILYCTGEEFTNDIVQSIQTKRTGQFKDRYRTADVLLIDDIQFIAGKNAVQEEFFHTFNALTKLQHQVVLTSDRPPQEIALLEDRLRSRFEAGLMIDIQQPSFELRTAILLVKSKAQHLSIPMELAKEIAAHVESARKIEGIITILRSEVELKGKSITPELIQSIISQESIVVRSKISATPSDVIKAVAAHFHLKQSSLKGKSRVKHLVAARHLTMYLMKQELSMPLVEIGKWFANRDHTSVLHAVRKVNDDLDQNYQLQQDLSAIRTTLSSVN